MDNQRSTQKGRGASGAPANRFERIATEADWEQLDEVDAVHERDRARPTEFLPDDSQTIIAENNSPDIPFRFSMNPYRGCEHGCAYCYARPTHEYLGLNAGEDFETKIMVKHRAAALLRDALNRPGWTGEFITLSGVTDCYQPAERQFRLTRSLLEVLLEARQAVGIVTKNALVLRDLDLLKPLAEARLVHVYLSITTLDAELARRLEPRTSVPAARLRAVEALAAAGVPVGVMMAPLIPGLTDHEIPALLTAARDAGAGSARFVMLRLPLTVRPVFQDWLARHVPDRQAAIEGLIRGARGGKLNNAEFGDRMRGAGEYAEQISRTFQVFSNKLGLAGDLPAFDTSLFRPPRNGAGQGRLF